MKTVIVPRGLSLIDEIRPAISGEGRDYSSSLVVFPGKRPAHFLRKALADTSGSSFIPPKILSMDEFVDLIFEQFDSRKRIENMDAVALLYRIHLQSPKRLGGEGFMTPDSFLPLGVRIYRDIEELTIEGISSGRVREIDAFMADDISGYTRERFQSLSLFYETFYREAAAGGFSTRSERYVAVSERIGEAGLDQYGAVIFGGFFALTKAEKDLFQKLGSHENVRFYFQEGEGSAGKLAELGIAAGDRHHGAAGPEVRLYSSPDSHGQVLALGTILAEQLAAEGIDEKTVVVLPSSETLFPLMRQGLASLPDDGYNISLGYPMLRTPVFGFLNNLMELVTSMDGDRVYVPDYLKFVLHPYTKNIYYQGRSETTRILFHTIEEELLRQRMKTFVTLAEIEESILLFDAVMRRLPAEEKDVTPERLRDHLRTIHRSTIGKFLSFRNIGDFAKRCIEVLISVSNNSTARLHPLFYPFSEAFIAGLDGIAQSLMRDISFAEHTSYFSFLRRSMMPCHVPFPGTPVQGLQVLGFLETRNLKFDRVFILDANEEVLPDTRKEETLLPFRVREKLGLPTYADRDRLTAYYFDTLIGGAKEAHIFFVEDDKRERSRFVEKLLWAKQKKDRVADAKAYIAQVQYRVTLADRPPAAMEKTADMAAFLRGFSFSSTALNEYLRCPLGFFYSAVMRIRRKEEISGDIERVDLGIFVHEVLADFFRDRTGRILIEADLDSSRMEVLIERLFERTYGSDVAGSVFLLKRQIIRQMSELLIRYYAPLISERNITILGCERPVEVTVDSFSLRGRLDSIEQRDGRTCIIDFKTGAGKGPLRIDMEKLDPDRRETWEGAIGSLQLPFYILLYSEKERIPFHELEAMFLLLGRSKMDRDIELPLFGSEEPGDVFIPLRKVIFRLMEEIIDPTMPFSPPADLRKACPGCDFQYLCGTQWIAK